MTVRIGINGFGRMGRLVVRAGWQSSGLSFVHVNETKGGVGAATHFLKFERIDSVRVEFEVNRAEQHVRR